jgi:membrane associated rhomboid family serine protease
VTPAVRTLLIATVVAFLAQMAMPGLADALVFVPQLVLVRPWTIVTYMFLHAGLTHILFNMIALYFFGPRVEARIGTRRFTILYFLSGISGALLSFVLAPGTPIIGASAGVFGVMLGFAHYWPREPVYIWGVLPVPARLLVLITTALALWSGFTGSHGGIADFAHLGGYAGAFVYLQWIDRSRRDFRRRVAAPPPGLERRPSGYRVIDRSAIHEVNRAEVDRILDKINAQGIESLTAEERTFLSHFVPPDDRTPPRS